MRPILLLSILLAGSPVGPADACLRDDASTTRGMALTRGIAAPRPIVPMATAKHPAILKIAAGGAGADILRVTLGLPIRTEFATSKRIVASLSFRLPPPIGTNCGSPRRFPLGMVSFKSAGDRDQVHFDVLIADLPDHVRASLLGGSASLKVEAAGLMIGEATISILSVEYLKTRS